MMNFSKLVKAACLIYLLCIAAIYVDSRNSTGFVADVGVVYGNKVEVTGLPSKRLEARLLAALELYTKKQVGKLIVSGGIGIEGYDEAQIMASYLISQGVSEDDILIDNLGYNSHSTSLNAAKLLSNKTSVVAISQQYHISRAKLSLRNAGFQYVYGYSPHFVELRDVYSYFREAPAWLKYWAFEL
ncbi:YdcF family protein [Vibrio sp. Of7-15]|uniref:YdcF family protein n=1 Tax=Vibrio sp. Of7-15 TaxID=2724879 RepID=UPI001EF2FF13|nr:YdcF family protein [Vibrio sp. Of7-15]MCG7499708.1 YdcF family protein [Vibrio sp. Of7-15]